MEADLDRDGKISFEEFTKMVENTDVSMSMTLGISPSFKPTDLQLSRRIVAIRATALIWLDTFRDDANFSLQSKSERQIPRERPFLFMSASHRQTYKFSQRRCESTIPGFLCDGNNHMRLCKT